MPVQVADKLKQLESGKATGSLGRIAVKNLNKRMEDRFAFFGDIPGRIRVRESEELLTFFPLDISKKGLGLLLKPCPEKGEELLVELGSRGPALRFTVRHIHEGATYSHEGFEDMKRCGSELSAEQQSGIDLIEIFTRYASGAVSD